MRRLWPMMPLLLRGAWMLAPVWLWLPARQLASAALAATPSSVPDWVPQDALERLGVTAATLGPALVLAAVLLLYHLRLAERAMLFVASAALVGSAVWSAFEEYLRLAAYHD